jgi:helix-turn-helix protein
MRERQQLGAQPAELKPLFTLDQVAQTLGVSKAWVRDHATRRSPRIPAVRFGDRRAVLRFRPQDIEQFIADNLLRTERVQ